ncbi:hypothetical protein GCM10022215_31690 [Nocardioides fonticola]|uniref:Uncharacterized protein n=1 Tax=Nocardioides fonticola TaxID=450363 RepID=A0ABP7XR76_9ACTN
MLSPLDPSASFAGTGTFYDTAGRSNSALARLTDNQPTLLLLRVAAKAWNGAEREATEPRIHAQIAVFRPVESGNPLVQLPPRAPPHQPQVFGPGADVVLARCHLLAGA